MDKEIEISLKPVDFQHGCKRCGRGCLVFPYCANCRGIMHMAENKTISFRRYKIYSRDGFACLKCGSKSELTLDHVIPLSLGGRDGYKNLQTLCYGCNQAKGVTIVDYRKHAKAAIL